jgi:putative MATE family efflux protein
MISGRQKKVSEEVEKGKNSNIDLLLGDSHVAIRKLAWPMMVSMFLIMAYNLADSIWVAGLGSEPLAAIGFITPLFMIVVGLGNGIGAGANSLIARCIGARDKEKADNAGLHSILITVIVSILFSIILCILLPFILQIMGAGSATQQALQYGYIVFIFLVVFIFSSVATSLLRSEGDVNRAMYVMAATAILNIVLDPIFIYIFHLGVAGAAIATVISSFLSCAILIYWIWIKRDTYLDLGKSHFHYETSILKDILIVAVPSTAENLIFSILGIIENYLLVIVAGTVAVATYTAGMRLVQMAMIPLMGLGTALLTVAGAAYGGHDSEKLEDAFRYTLKIGTLISIIMIILLYVFAPQVSLIFSYSSASAGLSAKIIVMLRILCVFIVGVNFGMMSAMVFQGVGKGFTSLVLTTIRALLMEVLFSYIFGVVMGMGEIGIYYGVVCGVCLGAVISYIWAELYIKKLKKVYPPQDAEPLTE